MSILSQSRSAIMSLFAPRFRSFTQERCDRSAIASASTCPSISNGAALTLERIRDAIDRSDLHSQLGFALSDRIVRAEIEGLNKALDEKFSANALTSAEPKGKTFGAAAAKVMPEDQAKLGQSWSLFSAAQKVAAYEKEQTQARTKAQNPDQEMTR